MKLKAVVHIRKGKVTSISFPGLVFVSQLVSLLTIINPPYEGNSDRYYQMSIRESARRLMSERVGYESLSREYCYREGCKLWKDMYESHDTMRLPHWFIAGYGYEIDFGGVRTIQIDVKPTYERLVAAGVEIDFQES